jgi:nucleotide-binding universal stress UspA family protein
MGTIVLGYDASPGAERALETPLDVEAEVQLVQKRPSAALTELAEREDARMIVVGTYGESPIKGAILGSTPHKLLHLSDRPVLVVPGG